MLELELLGKELRKKKYILAAEAITRLGRSLFRAHLLPFSLHELSNYSPEDLQVSLAETTQPKVLLASRVGTNVAIIREINQISVLELSESAKLSRSQLFRIESLESEPKEGLIRKLAGALHVPVGVLFGQKNYPGGH